MTLARTDIAAIAARLISAQDRVATLAPITATEPTFDVAAGYDVLREIETRRMSGGWIPVGRKIGFTNRTIWPRYGVYEPIWGTVYDRTSTLSSGNRARVRLQGLVQPRIEPEICFGLKAPPPRSRDPHAILAAVDWVAHAVEIVQCFHPGWKVTLPDSTTANGLHGRLILGEQIPVSRFRGLEWRLPKIEVTLRKGDKAVDKGYGLNVLDSPLFALSHLVEVLAMQPEFDQLHAGEMVTTGTLTDAHPVKAGETWSTAFNGLPLPGLTIAFK